MRNKDCKVYFKRNDSALGLFLEHYKLDQLGLLVDHKPLRRIEITERQMIELGPRRIPDFIHAEMLNNDFDVKINILVWTEPSTGNRIIIQDRWESIKDYGNYGYIYTN